MPSEGMEEPRPSPSHLTVVLGCLLDTAGDKEGLVKETVCNSLQNLARIYTGEVVNNVCLYRQRNAKLSTSHLVILLNVLETVAQERGNDLHPDVVSQLVKFSVEEMIKSDSEYVTQSILSNILIALGAKHCTQVLSGVVPQLQPGCEAHPWIVHTLGHLAATNVTQFVPVIKVALDIMIPMMPTARNEQLRIAFAFAVGKFSEAIIEYLSVAEQERDIAVTKEAYTEEISQAYDVIANSWVQAKETKVTESAIRALGPVFSLLPLDKANSSTSRAVTCLLSAYKRPCLPHHLITQCLATILQSASPNVIQPLLESILYNLGNMVVVPPDYTLPHTVKQHSEVLRCYDHLGLHFSERLGDLLIKHLRMGNERDKIEALVVCAHLISAGENILKNRIGEITSALRSVLSDPSVKVKKALVKTIVSLACKGHCDDGADFIEFLVRHCSSLPTHVGPDYTELATICSSTIHLLSSTVESLRMLLWTTLLKLLTDSTYDSAVPIITKALTQIAPKLEPTKEGEAHVGPSRESVLGRCFALLGSPLNTNRGPSILCFLQYYSPHVSLHIGDLWAHKLPQLINYLQVSEWSENEWDSLLLELINNTVTTISCHDSQWPVSMSNELSCLLSTCSPVDEASVVLSALAITTAVIEDKQVVSTHLDTILGKLKANYMDSKVIQKACARAVGILSTAHLDLVLGRLEAIAQTELSRRNSRLLGLMKDSKADAEMEKCREALLDCYASIAHRCPLMELLPKLDNLSNWIMSQITAAKEPSGREAAMEAILNCAESLVRHKTEAKHTIKCRSQILAVVMQHIQTSKPDPMAIKVTTALVKLPPSLLSEARLHILKTCFDSVLAQEPPANGHDNTTVMQTLKHLGELIEELLLDSVTPDRLDEVTTLLEPWIKDRNPQQRLHAIITLRTALLSYYHHMNPTYQTGDWACVQNPSTFNQSGDLIGNMVVRYFDSSAEVGKIAGHCAGIILAISAIYEGHTHDPALEKIFENLPEEDTSWHMAKILCSKLHHPQLHKLTGRLLDGLTDFDVTACCNASDALAAVFTLKGAELYHYVNDILGSLLLQLTSSLKSPSNGVNAVVALAKHHPKLVINILLKQPLPLHASVSDCWITLARDPGLSSFAIEHLLHIISTSELYDDQAANSTRAKIAALQTLAAVSGLSEMVQSGTMGPLLRQNLPQLLPSLLTLISAYIGTSPPVVAPSPSKSSIITNRDAFRIVPAKEVRHCLQKVLLGVDCDAGAEALIATAQLQHIDSLITAIPSVTLSICQSFPQMLPKIMAVMSQYATSNYESQRIIITAFYSECLAVQSSGKMGDVNLVDTLVSCLLSAIVDPDHIVRAIALKGLNYIAQLPHSQRKKHEDNVLTALMQGIDDTDGAVHTRIPLEAITSLSTLLPTLDAETLIRIQNPVAIRIKPFFEKEELALRSVSLHLFGQLASSDNAAGQEGYLEQVRSCLASLILHLSEPESSVVKACKYTLRQVSPVLGAPRVAAMFQDHLIDDMTLHYEQFITALAKIIVEEMGEVAVNMVTTSMTYTKSSWPVIRGNAALLAGLLYKNMSVDMKGAIALDPIVSRLLQLISDSNKQVRAKAAQALATLFLT